MIVAQAAGVLTVQPRSFGTRHRLEWVPIRASANQFAPEGALLVGNNVQGNQYSCRFHLNCVTDAGAGRHGDYILGATHFPREDGYCCVAEDSSVNGGVAVSSECEILVQHC